MSSAGSADEIHEENIQSLRTAQEWAGLILYWISHDYQDALQDSMILLDEHQGRQAYYHDLACFLRTALCHMEGPDNVPERSIEALKEHLDDPSLSPTEEAALKILVLWPAWVVCTGFPNASDMQLERGVQAANQAFVACRHLDKEVQAKFLVILAVGNARLGKSVVAEKYIQDALRLYEELHRSQPEIFERHMTECRRLVKEFRPGRSLQERMTGELLLNALARMLWMFSLVGCLAAKVSPSDPRLYLIVGACMYLGHLAVTYLEEKGKRERIKTRNR